MSQPELMITSVQKEMLAEKSGEARGWILYDDTCGFCRRWVPFWDFALSKRGFGHAPLQSDWARRYLQLPETELLRDLRLLLQDGQQVLGANVYRYMTRRIWWAFPVWLFSVTPGGRQLFDFGYRTFAKNRFRFSRACGLHERPMAR